MGKDDVQWGPKFPHYLATFENSIDTSFDRYTERKESLTKAPHDLIPLGLLETTLAVGENMHKVGFHTGNKIFSVLIETIRGYSDIHRGEVFGYYYGFLCVRHLIRMICIGTLTQNGALEAFLKDVGSSMPRSAATVCLAKRALGFMTKALYTNDIVNIAGALGHNPRTGNAFVIDGGLNSRDVQFLIDVIWKSRKAIMPLRMGGLLPGLPSLVFVLCQMTIFSDTPSPTRPWLKLQDILLRCYLSNTTMPERDILRQLSVYIYNRVEDHDLLNDYVPVDQEDFCTISGAWIELLTPPLDLALAPVMLLDISIIIFRWIFCLMTNVDENKLVAEWLVPAIVQAGFERLRLEIDREWDGPMLAPRRGFTRNYAAELLFHSAMLGEWVHSPTVKAKFVQNVFELDLHGLTGRVLLLVTREPAEVSELERDKLMHYIDGIDRMNQALAKLPAYPKDLAESIVADWWKVNLQLANYRFGLIHSEAPKDLYKESMDVWGPFLPQKLTNKIRISLVAYKCNYPRCADPSVYPRHPESNTACQRCGKAWYCSARCQQMHYALHTVDSHSVCG